MDNIQRLRQKKLFLFDMDGTIYLDDILFDKVVDLLDYIDKIKGKYMFLTNNSSKSIEDYIKKMKSFGINVDRTNFVTSGQAMGSFLKNSYLNKPIYVLGTESFKKELGDMGLHIADSDEESVDCLVVGFDTELNYQKLTDACKLLSKGVAYYATNPDLVCPASFGFIPDCGSICQMIETATGKKPIYIGKPEPSMIDLALASTNFKKSETIMVGDRLYTDIACGINAGVDTAVVFTGESKAIDLEKTMFNPTFVFEEIKELVEVLV